MESIEKFVGDQFFVFYPDNFDSLQKFLFKRYECNFYNETASSHAHQILPQTCFAIRSRGGFRGIFHSLLEACPISALHLHAITYKLKSEFQEDCHNSPLDQPLRSNCGNYYVLNDPHILMTCMSYACWQVKSMRQNNIMKPIGYNHEFDRETFVNTLYCLD